MLKRFFLVLPCFYFAFSSLSQIWVPATPFPGATSGENSCSVQAIVNSLCEFNNELYIGGNFTSIGGIVAHGIAKWNGSTWSSVGAGNFLQNTCVSDIIVYNSEVYFTAEKLYKWDGTTIQEFTYFDPIYQDTFPVYGEDLHVHNGELYISRVTSGLLKYNGSSFTLLPLPVNSNTIGIVYCIDFLNDQLYIGASQGLFKYQNGNWIDCNGITTQAPEVYDIEPFNNELYVLGYFNSIGGLFVNNFAKYNGSTWTNIILPDGHYPQTAFWAYSNLGTHHLKAMNNELYLAHSFYAPPVFPPSTLTLSPLIKFNGIQWSQIAQNGNGNTAGGCSIYYNNELYCGGKFITGFEGVGFINHLAKLQGTLNVEESSENSFDISPNPTSGMLTIKFDKTALNDHYFISDQYGKVLLEGEIEQYEQVIDISSFTNGIYFLSMEGFEEVQRVVKN
jgi:hypothetical protein